jgi:hypothetical protein
MDQVNGAVPEDHVTVRGRHVNAPLFDALSVARVLGRQLSRSPQNPRKCADAVRRQMYHHKEGSGETGREQADQLHKGIYASGGSPNYYDIAGAHFPPGRRFS